MRGRSLRRFALATSLAAMTAALIAAPSSHAAVTLGQTFTPTDDFGGFGTFIQPTSPGNSYAAPFDGVITEWSYQPAVLDTPPPLKLKVVRSAGGDSFTTVGDSELRTPTPGILNAFTTRISVQAGDVIGYGITDTTFTFRRDQAGYASREIASDPPPGTTANYDGPNDGIQIDLSASLEADADSDGFGDETQDQCPTDASTQGACPGAGPGPGPGPGTGPAPGPGTGPAPGPGTGPAPGPGGTPVFCRGLPATIVGTEGNDVRVGSRGRDVIAGLGGNDRLVGLAGNDVICGGRGRDTLKGGKGKDTLLGQKGNDTLKGGPGNDKLSGKKGKDKLIGGGGKDKLKGGGGRDVCIGGKANDKASKCEVEKSI